MLAALKALDKNSRGLAAALDAVEAQALRHTEALTQRNAMLLLKGTMRCGGQARARASEAAQLALMHGGAAG